MKKTLRLFAGIILHPFKRVYELLYREKENEILAHRAKGRNNYKNWQRMHDMSHVTNTGYTTSPLYGKIGGFMIPC